MSRAGLGILRAGTALQILAVGSALTGAIVASAPAYAQDYTNITASGRVQLSDGKPVAGAAVKVRSSSQGFERTVTTSSDGAFSIPQLPPGNYDFEITANGYPTYTESGVSLNQTSAANLFTLGEVGADNAVTIVGRRQKVADFDRTTTGAVINVGDVATRVPVQRSLRDVILLAPGTIQGGSAQNGNFAGQSTIGGSSFSENAYYVNGLNITEFRQGFSPVAIPFDFYETVDVKSGGFQAEFGRATGGVVVATTKSGSNDFKGSLLVNYEPNWLKAKGRNTYEADNDGDASSRIDTVLQLSGPLIKDHLFFYGIYNARDVKSFSGGAGAATPDANTGAFQRNRSPFWGGKIDAIPFDGQRLEFTYFNSKSTTATATYGYNSDTNQIGAGISQSNSRGGGENWVGRYTGTFADWFTVSAAYGINKNRAGTLPLNVTDSRVIDYRSGAGVDIGHNTTASISTNDDRRRFYRGDIDIRANFLGSHHFRLGYDNERLTATAVSESIGDGTYSIFTVRSAKDVTRLPIGTTYISVRKFVNGGAFDTVNDAFYLQDSWSLLNDRLSLQLGVRNDRFVNKDAAGKAFYESGNQWAPRLGFAFDPNGDKRTKIYGSYGRYFLPIAANTNIRSAGSELDYTRYNLFTGQFNADGTPVYGAPILTVANSRACPGSTSGAANCVIIKDGSIVDPSSFIAQGLKPQSQDEFILGLERRLSDRWTVGLYGTYRKLNKVLEDVAVDQAAQKYCISKGFAQAQCEDIWSGFSQYVLINPGYNANIKLLPLPDGSQPVVPFTAAELGYPKAKRTYKAVTLKAEREFDGVWGLQGSYTWSDLKGNYEGGVKSDIGQSDSGATEDFDQPGFTLGSYGYLPNHRRHTFKLFGSYAVTDWFTVGANALVQSPKKFGCVGIVPEDVDPYAQQYKGGGWFCQGKLTPRASQFDGKWKKQIDLTFMAKLPTSFDASLRFDITNILGDKSALDYDELGDLDSGSPNPFYRYPLVYQEPRSARIQFRVGF